MVSRRFSKGLEITNDTIIALIEAKETSTLIGFLT